MKKKLLQLGLAGIVGSFLLTSPAGAMTTTIDVPANPPSPAVGTWRVTLDTLNGLDFTMKLEAKAGDLPNVGANTIGISMWKTLPPVAANVAGMTAIGVTHSPAPGGAWSPTLIPSLDPLKTDAKWDHTPLGAPVPASGADFLSGTFSVESGAKFVTIAIQGAGTTQWFIADQNLVPEPASMTLAFAGLAPLGLAVLRRRRRSTEADEKEEA